MGPLVFDRRAEVDGLFRYQKDEAAVIRWVLWHAGMRINARAWRNPFKRARGEGSLGTTGLGAGRFSNLEGLG